MLPAVVIVDVKASHISAAVKSAVPTVASVDTPFLTFEGLGTIKVPVNDALAYVIPFLTSAAIGKSPLAPASTSCCVVPFALTTVTFGLMFLNLTLPIDGAVSV